MGGDVFWGFEVSGSGLRDATFSTCNSAFDTYLWLHRLVGDDAWETVAYNDDSRECGTRAVLSTGPLSAGFYVLQLEGYGTQEGAFELEVSCGSWCGAALDALAGCGAAAAASCGGALTCRGAASGDTTGKPSLLGNDAGDAYYYVALPDGAAADTLRFSSCGSSFDNEASKSWCAFGSTGKPASFVRNKAYGTSTHLSGSPRQRRAASTDGSVSVSSSATQSAAEWSQSRRTRSQRSHGSATSPVELGSSRRLASSSRDSRRQRTHACHDVAL